MQKKDNIWGDVLREITMEDLKKALKRFKSGKAAGPSGVTYDLLKALDDTNLGPILQLMQECLEDREIPRELNRSMIRALPKTENGLADMNLTRPIALMEALGKLFERILFDRIVNILGEHDMIDMSQQGGRVGTRIPPVLGRPLESLRHIRVLVTSDELESHRHA